MKTTTNATVTFEIIYRKGCTSSIAYPMIIMAELVRSIWMAKGYQFEFLNTVFAYEIIFEFTGEDVIECGEVHTRSWMDMESIIDAQLVNIMGAIEGVEITAKYEFEHTEESAAEIATEIEAEARESV